MEQLLEKKFDIEAYRTEVAKKKDKSFLLIYPTLLGEAPMTLGMLGTVLIQEGFKVSTIVNTFQHPLSVEDFVNKAKEDKADWVGISMLSYQVLFSYEIADALRKEGFKVILGGAHPTVAPDEGAEHAEIVVRQEGEDTLKEIVQGKLPLSEIPGVTTNQVQAPDRPRINNPPIPDLSVYDKERYTDENGFIRGFHRIYTTRGCPGYCSFCDWKVFKQQMVEYDIKGMVEDILMRKEKYGIDSFTIADDCFTENSKRVFEFCRLIKPHNIVWRNNSRANLVSPEMLKAMKESGCHAISYGLESGDPETLRKIGKQITLEENINACKWAYEAGLECNGNLLTGFPFEKPENLRNTIAFIRAVWKYVTLFQVSGSIVPFPGTHLYKAYHKKYGFTKYWLKPEFQACGIQIYQNADNPYKVSNLYQRTLFDDAYIRDEKFFTYTDEYKEAVREMVLAIGEHNLEFMYKEQPIKKKLVFGLSKLSMWLADVAPGLEKKVMGTLFSGRSKIEDLRDKRRGIVKSKTIDNYSRSKKGFIWDDKKLMQPTEENCL